MAFILKFLASFILLSVVVVTFAIALRMGTADSLSGTPWTKGQTEELFESVQSSQFDPKKFRRPKKECEDHWQRVMRTLFMTEKDIQSFTGEYHRALDGIAGPSRETPQRIGRNEGTKIIVNLLIDKKEIDDGLDAKREECAAYFDGFILWMAKNYFGSTSKLIEEAIKRWHGTSNGGACES